MPVYVFGIILVSLSIWFAPFMLRSRTSVKAQQVSTRARWGIVLQIAGFSLLWQGRFWSAQFQTWKLIPGILFLAFACLLSWTAVRALGKQWRIDAGLNADHELVRSGPYALVRHPIYTSMLCVFLGTGILIASPPLFVAALVIFLIGVEIRVRTEDALLASRFGEEFVRYRRSAGAYLPGWKARS